MGVDFTSAVAALQGINSCGFAAQCKHLKEGASIYVWDGNYCALAVTERLGLEESGGMVRVGPVHYNTVEEVEQFGEVLGRLATREG